MPAPIAPPAPTLVGPAPHGKARGVVIYCGLASSALALLGVYLLQVTGPHFNIMLWHVNYVLPLGAILVGLVASSGYGVASWRTGTKITRGLFWTILGIQILIYFAAEYLGFTRGHRLLPDGTRMGFLAYYDFMARSMAFKHQYDSGMGSPLGPAGYFFRLLEIAGFCGGSLIVPAILRGHPYCQTCQRYMRTKQMGLIAASVPVQKVAKADARAAAAQQAAQNQAFAQGRAMAEALLKLSAASRSKDFFAALGTLAPWEKAANALPARFSVGLVHCRQCQSGWLWLRLLTGQGKHLKMKDVSRQDVPPEFVRAVVPPK